MIYHHSKHPKVTKKPLRASASNKGGVFGAKKSSQSATLARKLSSNQHVWRENSPTNHGARKIIEG